MTATISREELKTLIDGKGPLTLLEALGPRYFDNGHLPGARRIDHEDAGEQIGALARDRDAPIVVYCASETCRNSHVASAAIERAGYSNVRIYAEGKEDWTAAGLPLERAQATA